MARRGEAETGPGSASGFPSPTQDYFHGPLDLNRHLIADAASTFILRVTGSAMTAAGIADGDELVVNRGAAATDGRVIVAVVGGELIVRRLRLTARGPVLTAESPEFPDIVCGLGEELVVWGVALHCIHHL